MNAYSFRFSNRFRQKSDIQCLEMLENGSQNSAGVKVVRFKFSKNSTVDVNNSNILGVIMLDYLHFLTLGVNNSKNLCKPPDWQPAI